MKATSSEKPIDILAEIKRRNEMSPEERAAQAKIDAEADRAVHAQIERERTERAQLDYMADLNRQIPARFQARTFDDLIPVTANYDAMSTARTWLTKAEDNLEAGRGIWIIGPPGCGKTSIVAAMLYSLPTKANLYRKGRRLTAAYVNWARFVCDLNIRSRNEENDLLERKMRAADVLVIDDIGAEENNRISRALAYNVIDYRYSNRLPVFIATNLLSKEMKEQIGGRAVDRLFEMVPEVYRAKIVGDSFREKPEQLEAAQLARVK
jgi:DNA replication protein DnaC